MLKLNSKLDPFTALKLTASAALRDSFSSADLTNPRAATARRMRGQRQLLEARSVARQRLPHGEMLRFEQWLMNEVEARFKTRDFRARLEILHETPDEVARLPLHEAVQVVRQLASANHLDVVAQLRHAARVHQLISDECIEQALEALEEHRGKYGATFWSAEAQIALAHRRSPPEEIRKMQRKLGGQQPGLVRFFLEAAATRSDTAQLGTRQLAFLSRRIKNSALNERHKLHVQYRAAGVLPQIEQELETVLSYELLLPPLDVLLSAISIGYSVIALAYKIDGRAIEEFQALLSEHGEKILGVPTPGRGARGEGPYVCPAIASAIREAVRGLLSSPGYQPLVDEQRLAAAISGQLTADDASAREWLPHFVASFPYHPWAIQIRPALPLRTFAELSHDIAEERQPLNQSPVRQKVAQEFIGHVKTHAEPAFSLLLEDQPRGAAARLVSDSEYQKRLLEISKPARECLEIILAWSLLREALPLDALGVSLRLGLTNGRLVEATPLVPLFDGRSWKQLKGLGDLVELACALQLYQGATGDSNAKTSKRFAVTALMAQYRCDDLAGLVTKLFQNPRYEARLLDYFVMQVLDLPLIELLSGVQTTQKAQEELISALSAALEAGSPSTPAISARIAETEQAIAVAQTKGTIDATKVVVGESEIFQKALQEYGSTYDHVQRLVRDRPPEDIDLDALLRLRANDLSSDVSDPQRLLHEIFTGVLDLFLHDPSAGLDSVMGRRVRHGEITGALRGAVDLLGMISHRPKVGSDYEVPKRLHQELIAYPAKTRKAVAAALAKFSNSVDGLCQVLCDEVFQCAQQSANPRLKPAFALDGASRNFAGLFQMGLDAQPFEEFLSYCFTTFWIAIQRSIERERPTIETYVRKTIRDACTRLKSDLRSLNLPDTTLVDRSQVVMDRLPLQGEVVLSWLSVPKVDQTAASGIDEFARCTEMIVRNAHSDYSPDIEFNVPAELLSVNNGMLLYDALYILLDNTANHSKLGKPSIILLIQSLPGILRVSYASSMSPPVFTELEKGKLASIQNEIQTKGAASVARKNKGSGLGKLTSLTVGRGGALKIRLDEPSKCLTIDFDLPLYADAEHLPVDAGLKS